MFMRRIKVPFCIPFISDENFLNNPRDKDRRTFKLNER